MKASLIGWACMLVTGFAAEVIQFPVEVGSLKTALKTYEGAKIVGADPIGVKVVHESGTARVAFHLLPADLQGRFSHDRKKAAEFAMREHAMQNAYDLQVEKLERDAAAERARREVTSEGRRRRDQAELMRDSMRAENLQNYVFQLRSGIVNAEAEIKDRMLRAQQARLRGVRSSYYGSSGGSPRRYSRAYGIIRTTIPYERKIEQARLLIEQAEMEIARLERGD